MKNGMFNEKFKLDHILHESRVGLWYIEIEEGTAPRLYADWVMLELLGLEEGIDPEECYNHWHSRVEAEESELVDEIVEIMAAGEYGEVSYTWNHPHWGKIYVRCGGNRDQSWTKGVRLRGYHQNITERVSLKRETEQLKSFHETMLMSLKELYFSVLLLDVEKSTVYPLHISEDGKVFPGEKAEATYVLEHMISVYHPEDQLRIQEEISYEMLAKCLEEKKKKYIREYRRMIQGKYRWISLTCYFMYGSTGRRKVLIALQDIDEQKRQEKEYQEYLKNRYKANMEILRMSLNNTNILEYFYYPMEERLVIPQKTAEYYGCATELKGINRENASKLVDENYCDLFCRVHERIKNGEKNDYFYFSCNRGKFWCKCSVSSVNCDMDGQTVFAVGVVEDLTKQRDMELENQRYQSIYRYTVEMEYDGICIVDLGTGEADIKISGHIRSHSMTKRNDLSHVKEDFIDKFVCQEEQERLRKEFDVLKILSKLDEEEVLHFYFTTGEKDGSRHKCGTIRYFDEDKTKLFICIRDIEQQIQKELESKDALQKAFDAAQRANDAKSDFIGRMSHDIRTPMNAIVGMTAIAEANIENRERVLDCLDKVKIANQHLLNLINEVLDMSRIESGKMDLSMGEFDLKEFLEEVTTVIQARAEAKRQTLTLELSNLEHTTVIGDYLGMQKIFHNLLGNAVKYTQDGGKIRLLAEEQTSLHQDYGYYRFVVEDNGFGMSEEYLEKLFVPFERANDPRVESIEGTGLGMPIVYNLIQLMRGELQVESVLNEGSRFIITLYLSLQSKVHTTEEEQEQDLGSVSFLGKRVLLAEDNELNVEIALEILKMYDLEVCVACNGQEAVEQYQSHEPGYFDIIFMDIQMPLMDGYTAAGKIRASNRKDSEEIPIVAMTANAFSEDVKKAIHTGMNDHVAKPIDIRLFTKVLSKWLLSSNK